MLLASIAFGLVTLFVWRVVDTMRRMEKCGDEGRIWMGWSSRAACHEMRESARR